MKLFSQSFFSFLIFAPLVTFLLLITKGLPTFAMGHEWDVLFWAFQVTWLPALMSGILFFLTMMSVSPWSSFFTQPYDFGRCFSFGAIIGAVVEAISTWTARELTHHPFSTFWIAGAMIAGSLIGAILSPLLWRANARKFCDRKKKC